MKLRPYQDDAIATIKADWRAGLTDVLAVLPTGSGKTVTFLHLLAGPDGVLGREKRGLVIAHRKDLIEQPMRRLKADIPAWKQRAGMVMAEHDQVDRQLVFASIQTLQQPHRLKWLLYHGAIDYLVIDEAHRARSYRDLIKTLKKKNPNLRHVGVTATPMSPGATLGKVYQHCSVKITLPSLIPQYLVPPRWLAIATGISLERVASSDGDFVVKQLASVFDQDDELGLMVASWKEHAWGRCTIAFTVSVKGAYALAKRFRVAGIPALALDGTSSQEERRAGLHALRSGKIKVLVNAQLFTEGTDVPEISCVMVGRPTHSDLTYLQMVGRGLRLAPGKNDCLILDFAPVETRNVMMAGDVLGEGRVEPTNALKPKRGQVIASGAHQLIAQSFSYLPGGHA